MRSDNAAPRRAFTLIELLIVVAIIAILAAIAVPNFLEAQTRSKVSRAKADMRSLATAIEAYYVDENAYPIPATEQGIVEITPTVEGFETRLTPLLTTPVAYFSGLPPAEPFPAREGGENQGFHYSNRQYFIDYDRAQGGPGDAAEFDDYAGFMFNPNAPSPRSNPNILYYILSHGPDADHDDPDAGNPALYDPTNGTISNGDIIYWGPSRGYKN